MTLCDEMLAALKKKALGHSENEKYYPPDLDAWRELKKYRNNKSNHFEFLSHEELVKEVEKLLEELKGGANES